MKLSFHISAVAVGLAAVLSVAPAHAVDRCNTKFEFKNEFDVPVIVSKLVIRGNQGDQVEEIRDKKIMPNARHTTRRNRLQKLDDGHEGDFYIWARFETPSRGTGDRVWILGTPYSVWYQNGIYFSQPGEPNYRLGRAVGVRKKALCRDRKTIKFVMKPMNDTPQNRARASSVLGVRKEQGWLDTYFD